MDSEEDRDLKEFTEWRAILEDDDDWDAELELAQAPKQLTDKPGVQVQDDKNKGSNDAWDYPLNNNYKQVNNAFHRALQLAFGSKTKTQGA